jgi:hypothetical protein
LRFLSMFIAPFCLSMAARREIHSSHKGDFFDDSGGFV